MTSYRARRKGEIRISSGRNNVEKARVRSAADDMVRERRRELRRQDAAPAVLAALAIAVILALMLLVALAVFRFGI